MEHWPEIAWIPCLLSGSLCLTAGLHLWRFREDPTIKPIIALMAAMTWWAISYALVLRLESLPAKDLLFRLVTVGASSVAISFLMLAMQFGGLDRLVNRRTVMVLGAVPLLAIILNLTNDYHHIMSSSMSLEPGKPEPIWVPHMGYWLLVFSYTSLICVIGTALVIKGLRHAEGLKGKRLKLIFLALIPTWLTASVYYTGLWRLEVDPTPILFGLCSLVVIYANFRYRLIAPYPLPENLQTSTLHLKLFSIRVASVVVMPTIVFFTTNNFLIGHYVTGVLLAIIFVGISGALAGMETALSVKTQLRLYNATIGASLIILGLVILYLLPYNGDVARGSWIYLFPILAVLGLGAKVGLAYAITLLAAVLLVALARGHMEILVNNGFDIRFVIIYLSQSLFIFFFERNRVRAIVSLYEQRDVLIESERRVVASLHENEALLKEVHHRVKNNMQVISSMLKLQAVRLNQPELAGAFIDSQSRVHAMSLIHEMLYQQNQYAYVDLKRYLQRLSRHLLSSYSEGQHRLQLDIEPEEVFINLDQAVPLGLIVNELLTNTLKHAFPGGRKGVISIAVCKFHDGELELRVADDGIGLPQNFDWRLSQSLGLKMMVGLAEKQLHGKIEMQESPGACFVLRFSCNDLR